MHHSLERPPKSETTVATDDLHVDIASLCQQNSLPGVSGMLRVPPFAFDPRDTWGDTFRAGLSKANLSGIVCEVGVGTGINVIHALARHKGIRFIYGTDIDARVVELAEANIGGIDGIEHAKFRKIGGSSDLLAGLRQQLGATYALDSVVACIPQVRLPKHGSCLADKLAHYYGGDADVPPGLEVIDHYDMTLNGRLLTQARDHLKAGEGRVILNLAGRVPLDVLNGMFTQTGYEPSVIHESVIEQHSQTRLEDMIEKEREFGITFEFFDCPDCQNKPLNAKTAQEIIDSSRPVFHKLYVLQGLYRGIN